MKTEMIRREEAHPFRNCPLVAPGSRGGRGESGALMRARDQAGQARRFSLCVVCRRLTAAAGRQ